MDRPLRTLLILALLTVGPAARSETAPMEVVPPARAQGRMQAGWDQLRAALSAPSLDRAQAKQALDHVLESKWDGGFEDQPIFSLALIEWADAFQDQGDRETADWLIESALRLSPRSSLVRFAAGRHFLAGGGFNPTRSLTHYLAGFRCLDHDFPTLFWMLGLGFLVPVLILAWFGSFFGLALAARYFGTLAHDVGDLFPAGKINRWLLRGITAVILFLPLAAGISPWWLISWWMILFFLYMQRPEKFIACLWFLALLMVPSLLERHTLMAGTRLDPTLQAALRVRDGTPLDSDLELLRQQTAQSENNALARFSLAQLLMRQGTVESVKTADGLYTSLASEPATAAAAFNNLAEIHYAAGDLKSVFDTLAQSERNGGPPLEITFNRSQYYQAMGQVSRRDEESEKVRARDQAAFNLFSERTGSPNRLNRVFIPLPAPTSLVMERAFESSPQELAAFQSIRSQWMGFAPPPGIGYYGVCAGGLLLLPIVSLLGRSWRLSKGCSSCGKPVCRVCQAPSKAPPNLCLACFTVFRGQGGDLKDKMGKRAEVQRYRDLWRWSGQLLSLAAPGAGHLLLGHPVLGSMLFICTSLILAASSAALLTPPPSNWVYQGGVSAQTLIMALAYLVLVVISLISYRARTEDWR